MPDDNKQDLTPYDLAERVKQGLHVTEQGHREIAEELLRLKLALDSIGNTVQLTFKGV